MNIILLLTLLFVLIIVMWALLGKGDSITEPSKEESPDKIFRKRATDQEIEKKFPDLAEHPRRRKSDYESIETLKDIEDEFNLPYKAEEIISETSRFRIYKRTLINSDIYAKKGDFLTAISLYEGVNSRINDSNTNFKIETNIDYLKKYRQYYEQRKREQEKIKSRYEDRKSSEIKLLIDGPMTIPEKIQISVSPQVQRLVGKPEIDIDRIVDEITRRLSEREPLEGEKPSLGYDMDPESLEKNLNQISRLKDEIDTMNNRINSLNESVSMGIVQKIPAIIEAKDNKPIPITMDAKPILEILENIPRLTSSEPSAVKFHSKKPAGKEIPDKIDRDELFRKETTERVRKPEDEDEEFELLSEHQEEEDIEDPSDELSDDDVFLKILGDEKKKGMGAIEILGDRKRESEYSYDLTDEEFEKKQREEEEFYGKFLRHERRKKKELPILKVTYDFSRLPDEFSLSRDKNILEYAFYKYKPLLEKANEYINKRLIKDAINYYKVVMSQNLPPEFKSMIRKNINDLIEYLEKYFATG
jgi:hypothetical protein